MKLLWDQGLPRSAVRHLVGMGIAAEHVGDLGMAKAADATILDVARGRQAIVVTLDADFHALLALARATGPSVVRLRIERFDGELLAAILAEVLAVGSDELEAGAVVSVTARRIRVAAASHRPLAAHLQDNATIYTSSLADFPWQPPALTAKL